MSKKDQHLKTATEKLQNTELPIRTRLAEAYNFGLMHLSDFDFIEDDQKSKFREITDTLQAEDAGKMPTRAHRSAEMLDLDRATELAADILGLANEKS